jgi:murein L,D-transpeptidase YcbB/YkuD
MSERRNTTGFDRRAFLAGAAATCGAAAACLGGAARAQENDPLQELIQRNQQEEFGQTFDAAANNKQMPTASLPTLSPATTQTTEAAVAQYEEIVARGGWPVVPPVQRLRLGMKHASVKPLRERLIVAGDLDARSGLNDTYDTYVEAAVRRFQTRHGLSPDGMVREQTLRSLNLPADARLNQLRTNVVRLRAFSGTLGPRFVMANIPAAWIEAVEGGVAVSRHTAVAGKPDRPSPDIQSKIVEINFNPYWTVPVSIVRKDLIPKMQAEPDYLSKYRIRIFDQRNNELTPAQAPCASISPARTASICTTRRSRTCSARTTASIPPAACGCRTCAISSTGCWPRRRAGRGRRSTRSSRRASARMPRS